MHYLLYAFADALWQDSICRRFSYPSGPYRLVSRSVRFFSVSAARELLTSNAYPELILTREDPLILVNCSRV